ncbi:MAG: carboxypeptidase regulatory-like domain-containing protein [Gammaproteobacteria bacterium]|nr:carboxypeptidase regulatory-like domain-containing protein [Gammaproteobacteria bacterium]
MSFAEDLPPYRPGMELPPGAYRVLVTRSGFLPELRTVRVSGATRMTIVLERDAGRSR